MLYKVLRNTIINGVIMDEGSVVEINDGEYVESLLADGNICKDDGTSIPVENPATEQVVAVTEATASPDPLVVGSGSEESPTPEAQVPVEQVQEPVAQTPTQVQPTASQIEKDMELENSGPVSTGLDAQINIQ